MSLQGELGRIKISCEEVDDCSHFFLMSSQGSEHGKLSEQCLWLEEMKVMLMTGDCGCGLEEIFNQAC